VSYRQDPRPARYDGSPTGRPCVVGQPRGSIPRSGEVNLLGCPQADAGHGGLRDFKLNRARRAALLLGKRKQHSRCPVLCRQSGTLLLLGDACRLFQTNGHPWWRCPGLQACELLKQSAERFRAADMVRLQNPAKNMKSSK
jgi:hypothetical protein